LNLCCGFKPLEDFLNVDIMDCAHILPNLFKGKDFVQWDLNKRPWPWPDDSCDVIVMRDGLEHLSGGTWLDVMNELWRLMQPLGQLVLQVPDAAKHTAFRDPTHQMFFTRGSFDYLDPSTELGKGYFHYTPFKWKIEREDITPDGRINIVLKKWAKGN